MRSWMRRPRWKLAVVGAALLALATIFATGPGAVAATTTGATGAASSSARPDLTTDTNAPCNVAPKPGYARCFAIVRTPSNHQIEAQAAAAGPPSGAMTPSNIQAAYHLPATGSGETVAIVDANGDSSAESDLATFRSYYGLPACTTANGCFRKVDQTGGTSYPGDDAGWAMETDLDLDMVSSACPACNIALVEANSSNVDDLAAAENEAVALGAKYISNSYGATEDPSLLSDDSAYDHQGVAVVASSGDTGNVIEWPSSNPDVTSVGGTTLTADSSSARGWDETAWSSGGSGCSTIEPQPQYQVGLTTDCSMRATTDVSADGDPNTGMGIYDTLGQGGWLQVGGTSMASPLIASVYALAGTPAAGTYPVNYLYHDPNQSADLYDITQGSNGSCGNLLCNAGVGWDGPTGLGTPDGVAAFAGQLVGTISGQVTDAATGQPMSGVAVTANPGNYAARTNSSGDYTIDAAAGTYTVSASTYAYQSGSDSGVQVAAGGTATANFTLTGLPHATVSGTVTDGSGQGWPLYAKITIGGGYPGGPVYTDPFTGKYSVTLAGPATYPVQITSAEPTVFGSPDGGYTTQNAELTVGSSGTVSQGYSLTVDTSSCTASGYGPTGLSEDFSGWTGSTPQDGWTVTGGGAGWAFDNPGNRPAPGAGLASDDFAIADSGTSGGSMDSTLTSPAVSLSGQSSPVVSFVSGYYGGSGQQAGVELSTDNGRTWTTIWHRASGDAVGPVSIPVPAAAGKPAVRVRFTYSGDDAWWWAVGSVVVGTPGCMAQPGGLVSGLVTDKGTSAPVNGATVTSTDGGAGFATGTSDPGVPGGLYELFVPAGSQQLSVTAAGYAAATATVNVTQGQVTREDWALSQAAGG